MRISQSRVDRLVEYVMGMGLEDSKLIDRLETDQMKVRAKYGLPDRKYRFANPSEYEAFLRELADGNGVRVRSKSDCGNFFEKYPFAGAVYLDQEKTVGVNIDKKSQDNYLKSLLLLEHELIHALQYKYYPGMPVEIQEYEAYVAGWNIDYLRENPEKVSDIFGFFVMGSVKHWYQETSENIHETLEPVWDSPEYFLINVDGVSQEQIDKYEKNLKLDGEVKTE
jgi:hypothetical protein